MTVTLVTLAVAVAIGVVQGIPTPAIIMSGNSPLKISEWYQPHDCNGGTGALSGQIPTPLPQAFGTAVVTVTQPGVTGNYAYFTGGLVNNTGQDMTTTTAYSLAGGATAGPSMITPRYLHGMAVLREGSSQTIIVCGGKTNGGVTVASCEKRTWGVGLVNAWRSLNPLATNLYGHSMISLESQQNVYIFGGDTGAGVNPNVYQYDVSSDSWLQITPSGGQWHGLVNHATFSILNDQVAVSCGGKGQGLLSEKYCYHYDPQSRAMTMKGTLNKPRQLFSIVPFTSTCNSGKKLYYFAIGGSDGVESSSSVEYSPDGVSWGLHPGSLFNSIAGAATASLT